MKLHDQEISRMKRRLASPACEDLACCIPSREERRIGAARNGRNFHPTPPQLPEVRVNGRNIPRSHDARPAPAEARATRTAAAMLRSTQPVSRLMVSAASHAFGWASAKSHSPLRLDDMAAATEGRA
jgi:hypothetical protein